jgi:hypothetical protein
MTFGKIAAEPFAGLTWVPLDTRCFSPARATKTTSAIRRSDCGYLLQNGMALITAHSGLAVLAFQSTGAAFGITGVPLTRDAALIEAGLDLQPTAQAKIGVAYIVQLANYPHNHSVKVPLHLAVLRLFPKILSGWGSCRGQNNCGFTGASSPRSP